MTEESRDEMLVGVVGDDPTPAVDALDDAGATPVVDTPRTVLDAASDAVVALGEPALLSVARERPSVPVLPVEAGRGVRSVSRDRLGDAITQFTGGDWTTESHPLVAVDDGDNRRLALKDAMLVTAEPAHISEFTVTAGGERIARFRADGILAATPAGTSGYARSAGAPVIPPGPSVLALAPIAPFATTLDHWVVPTASVTVSVERDGATVEVLADDRTIGEATVDVPVEFSAAGTVETIRVPAGRSPFSRRGEKLEKL